MSTLVLAAVLALQSQQTIQIQVPAPQYRIQVQPIYPQYQYYYTRPVPRPDTSVRYATPLQPGDLIVNERVGLFGWRREMKIYRRRSY